MLNSSLDDSVLVLLSQVRRIRPRNIAPVTHLKNYFKTFVGPIIFISQNNDAFIFKAQKKNGEQIAIKVILEQFTKEIQIINLHHESIIQCYNYYIVDQGIFVFEMELCDCNLEEYVKQLTLSKSEIYSLMKDIASALQYLHNSNLSHRRLHPTNILIHNNKAKLSNFRMLKVITKESENTYLTPKTCSAPEQLVLDRDGFKVFYGKCIDIWAFGIIFLWLFTQKFPFDPKIDDIGLIHGILVKFGNDIQSSSPPEVVPPEAFEIILSCLNIIPQNRPSASDLLSRMSDLIDSPDPDLSSPAEGNDLFFDDWDYM